MESGNGRGVFAALFLCVVASRVFRGCSQLTEPTAKKSFVSQGAGKRQPPHLRTCLPLDCLGQLANVERD